MAENFKKLLRKRQQGAVQICEIFLQFVLKVCVQETPVVATCKYRDRIDRYSYGFSQAPVHEPQTSTTNPDLVWKFYRSCCLLNDPRHVYNVYKSNTGLYNTIKFNCLAGTRCVQLTYLRATCKRVTR